MNRRTQNTVALYVVLAVLALVLLGLLDSGSPERELVAAATFASFALVVYALPYALSANGSQASPAFVAQLASVMLAPRWGTAAIAAVSVALGELLIRRSPIKATFNVAQHTLAISAAIASYVATGGASLLAGAEALERLGDLHLRQLWIRSICCCRKHGPKGVRRVAREHDRWLCL